MVGAVQILPGRPPGLMVESRCRAGPSFAVPRLASLNCRVGSWRNSLTQLRAAGKSRKGALVMDMHRYAMLRVLYACALREVRVA